MQDLPALRELIVKLDEELIANLAKRQEIVKQIGHYKAQHNLAVFDPLQEERLIHHHVKLCQKYNLSHSFITDIFMRILQESRRVQQDE